MQCLIGNAHPQPILWLDLRAKAYIRGLWPSPCTSRAIIDSFGLNKNDYAQDKTRIPPHRRLHARRTKSQARHRRPRTTSHSYTSTDQSPRRRTQLPGCEHCQRRQSLARDTLWDSLQRCSRRGRGQRRASLDVQYRRQGIANRRHGESHGSRSNTVVACCR
jgi:hypothetical protein